MRLMSPTIEEGESGLFALWYTYKHMNRRIAYCAVLTFIPCVFILLTYGINMSVEAQRLQLRHLYETFQIDGVLVEKKTSRDDGLSIDFETLALFISEDSPFAFYIKDVGLKRIMWYSPDMGENPFPRFETDFPNLVGINRLSVAFSQSRMPDVAFYTGYNETHLLGNDRVCIVSREMASSLQRGSDGMAWIGMNVKNPYNIGGAGFVKACFAVIGEYDGEGDTLYCPYAAATDLGHEIGSAYDYASRLTFIIRDNYQLPQFKKVAAAIFSKMEYGSGHTLLIHDSNFYEAVSAVEKNIGLLQIFKPLLLCLCAVIGFMASLLSVRGRKKEIVILRCLGIGKGSVFQIIMLEQLFLSILGVVAGIVLYGFAQQTWRLYMVESILCLACYWIGMTVAFTQVVKGDLLIMLKAGE